MYVGGYITVIRTDVLQWSLLSLIFIPALFYYPTPTVSEITTDVVNMGTKGAIGFLLFTFMLIISNADVWQRMMSAKNAVTAKKSLVWSGVIFLIFQFAGIILSLIHI